MQSESHLNQNVTEFSIVSICFYCWSIRVFYFLNKAKFIFGMEAQVTIGLVELGVKNAFLGTEVTPVTEQRNLAMENCSISCN